MSRHDLLDDALAPQGQQAHDVRHAGASLLTNFLWGNNCFPVIYIPLCCQAAVGWRLCRWQCEHFQVRCRNFSAQSDQCHWAAWTLRSTIKWLMVSGKFDSNTCLRRGEHSSPPLCLWLLWDMLLEKNSKKRHLVEKWTDQIKFRAENNVLPKNIQEFFIKKREFI